MSHLRIGALAAAALLALGVAATTSAQTAQRTLMKQCNIHANARHLMGRDRQMFMQKCLSGRRQQALNSQQQRMRSCNAQARAKGLRGADQRRYVSSCLRVR